MAIIGANPTDALTVNTQVGNLCRQFIILKDTVHRFQSFMAATDLTASPYSFTSGDQANVKSAISGLDTALQAVDATFINRTTGLF
jgi:hypothetical protein